MATEGMVLEDGTWVGAKGSPHRTLTPQEVADLQAYADRITADEVLVPAYVDDYGRSLPAITRLADLHNHWDAQHPLFREALTGRNLHPQT